MKASVEGEFKNALQRYAQGFLVSIEQQFETTLQSRSNAANGLCVAYSGGLDSTVLLHIADAFCKQANIALTAAHVNHGISPNSEAWEKHCKKQCAQRNIPFYTQSLALTKTAQQSLEADAREARYRILDEFAGLNRIVLLAQHQNDQAETLFIQLKRGAGIKGLAAMPSLITKASGVQYLRPLLTIAREDLLVYATQHQLSWLEDESNQDNSFDRNFLRNQVFPLLTNRWPSFNKTVARSARHCGKANEVNMEYMHLLSNRLIDNHNLNVSELSKHSDATQECFVRYWLLAEHGLTPSSAQLNDIVKLTKVLKSDANKSSKKASPHIVLANSVIERYKDKLIVMSGAQQSVLSTNLKLLLTPSPIKWESQLQIELNASYILKKVEASCANKPNVFLLPEKGVQFVFGGSNLSFKYKSNRPTKTVKAWYQEWGVSPMQRQQIPVFICNDRAIAIGLDPIKQSCNYLEPAIYVELGKKTLI